MKHLNKTERRERVSCTTRCRLPTREDILDDKNFVVATGWVKIVQVIFECIQRIIGFSHVKTAHCMLFTCEDKFDDFSQPLATKIISPLELNAEQFCRYHRMRKIVQLVIAH